ncbi:hypothetical protein FF100_04830 [Methylobacterium terricola]|uniref:Putative tail fiber protein gp53-like C-terminal domain-containing protein n=1 Tax=Methylobacterium terricola TaxID=2583531 RepID=A0A5C4LLI1_9HYPH|nr:hypothetical protein [Methylobacterium terricola]TNC14903.1 hypothetical protein FF100_04830 [Methylobacterium terricola]
MATRRPLVANSGRADEISASDVLAPATLGYSSGSNANGTWWKAPDGIIEQFGTVTLTNGTVTVTFPIAFPNACFHVDPVPVSVSAVGTSVSAWLNAVPSKTNATINGRSFTTVLGVLNIGLGSFDLKWHAIGN